MHTPIAPLPRPSRPASRGAVPHRWLGLLAGAFTLGLALGLAPSGRVALACSCLPPPPPGQALQASAAVFDGTVTRVELVDPADPFPDRRVTFVVYTQWKGVTAGTFTVTTAADSALCGVNFQLGRRYIVYVTGGPSGNQVNLCSRTAPYVLAEAAALGPDEPPPGAVPASAWAEAPPGAGCPRCAAPPPPREAMAQAAAVFHGRLVGVTTLGPARGFDHVATFEILGWWKGASSATVDVRLPWNVWFCGGPLGSADNGPAWGERIVYADADPDGGLVLAICGRTRDYDAAEAAALGVPNPPPTPPPATATDVAPTPTNPPGVTPTPTAPTPTTPPEVTPSPTMPATTPATATPTSGTAAASTPTPAGSPTATPPGARWRVWLPWCGNPGAG